MADDPKLAHQHALAAARARILRRFDGAALRDLERLADVLEDLPDVDVARVARYAEALAEWPIDDVG